MDDSGRKSDRSLLITWCKRIWTLPELISMKGRRSWLRLLGCTIAKNVFISRLELRGHYRRLSIGQGSIVGRAEIHLLDNVSIGENVTINDGVCLLTGSHDVHSGYYEHITKPITIKNYVWIATNAIVLPGVTIGEGAVIGAGAVVTKDIAPFMICVGNPAVPIGTRRIKNPTYQPYKNAASIAAWLSKSS